MASGGKRPDDQIHGIADPRPETIDEPARKQEADRVGERERCADLAVLAIAPSDLVSEQRREDAKDGTVDIVDRGGEK